MSTSDTKIGVVGGGQLARMLVQAAQDRDIPVAVQTSSAEDPAADASSHLVVADPRDVAGTRELVVGCQTRTFEVQMFQPGVISLIREDGTAELFHKQATNVVPLAKK